MVLNSKARFWSHFIDIDKGASDRGVALDSAVPWHRQRVKSRKDTIDGTFTSLLIGGLQLTTRLEPVPIHQS